MTPSRALNILPALFLSCSSWAGQLRGVIVNGSNGSPVAAHLYIQRHGGEWLFAQSAHSARSAITYSKRRSADSAEIHTTLSAHPFSAQLPPGPYTITAKRGKEYLPSIKTVLVEEGPTEIEIKLRPRMRMAEHGRHSGETHVHGGMEELPNLLLAEDLNVALPLTYRVTAADTPPSQGDKNSTASSRSSRYLCLQESHSRRIRLFQRRGTCTAKPMFRAFKGFQLMLNTVLSELRLH